MTQKQKKTVQRSEEDWQGQVEMEDSVKMHIVIENVFMIPCTMYSGYRWINPGEMAQLMTASAAKDNDLN